MSRNLRQSKAIRAGVRRTPIVLLFFAVAAIIAADRFLHLGLTGFDYAALVLVSLFALKGYLQGLVNTIAGLVGSIAGIIGAILLSPPLASLLMRSTGLGESLSKRLQELVPALVRIPMAAPDATGKLTSATDWLTGNPAAMDALKDNPLLTQVLGTANPVLPQGMDFSAPVANLNDWLVWSLLRILSVFLLFIVLKLTFVLLGKLITALMNLSLVMGTANRMGGMALGLLVGLILLVLLISTLLPFLGSLRILKMPDAFTDSKFVAWFNQIVAWRARLG